jgi:hypothetical protein
LTPAPLGLRLQPVGDEPSHGVFVRLAIRHRAHSLSWFASNLGMKLTDLMRGDHREAIAAFAGLDIALLAESPVLLPSQKATWTIRGEDVSTTDWTTKRRQYCPACFRDDIAQARRLRTDRDHLLYHRGIWDFSSIDTCQIHGLQLINICERCREPLDWKMPTIGRCAKGCDLSVVVGIPSAKPALARYLTDRLGYGPQQPRLHCPDLSFHDTVRLCEIMGFVVTNNASHHRASRNAERRRAVRPVGYDALAGGPTAILAALDDFQKGIRQKHKSYPVLSGAYGWLYSLIAQPYGPAEAWLRPFVRTHAIRKGLCSAQEPILGYLPPETLSVGDACRMLGSSYTKTKRRLARQKLLPETLRRGVRATIDIASCCRLADEKEDVRLGSRAIGEVLGVGRGAARELVALKLIGSNDRVTAKDVCDFERRILDKCIPLVMPTTALPIRLAADSRNMRVAWLFRLILLGQLPVRLAMSREKHKLAEKLFVVAKQLPRPPDQERPMPLVLAAEILSVHPEVVGTLVNAGVIARVNGRGICAFSVKDFLREYFPVTHANATLLSSPAWQRMPDWVKERHRAFSGLGLRQIIYPRYLLEYLAELDRQIAAGTDNWFDILFSAQHIAYRSR